MTYEPVELIEVHAWDAFVGVVAMNPATGWYSFEYTPDWLRTGVELAPLHLPLRPGPFEFPELAPKTFWRLPALLADALPDSFGNALVDRWMAEQGIATDQVTPLDRLAYAADRGMGALVFRPPARGADDLEPTAVALADLVVAARNVITGQLDGEAAARSALNQLIQVGTSAPGARAKAVISYNPATSQIRSPHAAVAEGFESWLIKLDGVSASGLDGHGDGLGDSAPYGRIEFAYHLMARAAGLVMAPCRLLAEGPRRHFMTRRFDRDDAAGTRHHVLSLCAMAHLDFNLAGAHSYDQYFQAIDRLGLGPDAREQAFRRMVFNVAGVNRDDHTKNLSFLLTQGGDWGLAPAYDVTHAYRADGGWTSTHQMTVNGKVEAIGRADLEAVGARHDVPGHRRVIAEVLAVVEKWRTYAAEAELDDATTAAIEADHVRFRPV